MHHFFRSVALSAIGSIGIKKIPLVDAELNSDIQTLSQITKADIKEALDRFLCITLSKLTVGAYAWSLGFGLLDGEDCWARDDTFSHAPHGSSCTIMSMVFSGLLASTALCFTILVVEIAILPRPSCVNGDSHHTKWQTYVLLFFSVWISDASWSFWNWISYSIGNDTDSFTGSKDNMAGFAVGSLLGFALNSLLFYMLHNGGRWLLLRFANVKGNELWHCDVSFTGALYGAYYGFGPLAVYLCSAFDATNLESLALCNALGTLLGSLVMVTFVYSLPIWWWLYTDQSESNITPSNNVNTSVDDSETNTNVTVVKGKGSSVAGNLSVFQIENPMKKDDVLHAWLV